MRETKVTGVAAFGGVPGHPNILAVAHVESTPLRREAYAGTLPENVTNQNLKPLSLQHALVSCATMLNG